MELWQTAAQELDRLQQAYQKTISDGQIHNAQRQQLKVHFSISRIKMQSVGFLPINSTSAFHHKMEPAWWNWGQLEHFDLS